MAPLPPEVGAQRSRERQAAFQTPRAGGGERVRALQALRARVARLERPANQETAAVFSLGDPRLDGLLPGGGLALAGLHQIVPARLEWDDGALAGFTAALLARLRLSDRAGAHRPLLWVSRFTDFHLPGLRTFGLGSEEFLCVRPDSETALFWTLEEALASGALSAVVGEAEALDRVTGRRLQLAAEAAGLPCFLIQRRRVAARRAEPPSTALTRWRVMAAPSDPSLPLEEIGRPRWRVDLERCRGGALPAGGLILEWNDAAGGFAMVAGLGGGASFSDAPAAAARV